MHLRALKGLYRLTGFWAGSTATASCCALRNWSSAASSEVMKDPRFAASQQALLIQELFADELRWLGRTLPVAPETFCPWTPDQLQAALRDDAGPRATHGALVLLRVTDRIDAASAPSPRSRRAARCRWPTTAKSAVHVALTMAGLRALRIHPERLDRFPPEFRGMEARAGLLGDVRGNHPDHWRRPLRHGVDRCARTASTSVPCTSWSVLRLLDRSDPGHANCMTS